MGNRKGCPDMARTAWHARQSNHDKVCTKSSSSEILSALRQGIVGALSGHCRSTVGALSGHCRGIVGAGFTPARINALFNTEYN